MTREISIVADEASLIRYITEVCPRCNQISPYIPNPIYYHKCDNCGFNGNQSDLISVLNDIQLKEDLQKIKLAIKNSNRSLLSKVMNKKE